MREHCRIDDRGRVVQQLTEEAEGVLLAETRGSKVADLHFEALSLVVERPDGAIELRCQELQGVISGKPRVQGLARRLPKAAKLGAPPRDMRRFIEQHE